ncbi:hypothetical protein L2E82_24913 [Cichorium intybus]|uniref:Uncharacterized protein n=1 Tax=Cichorium intybus TaxID=13427 RepID=A0ACB9E1L3_CICIN|nr:hypothetical protein L2E82_24913 [Cichorium intybus]
MEGAQINNSKKDQEGQWENDPLEKTQDDLDHRKKECIPEALIGVSDRLKHLLSTSTPIKDKIKRRDDEIKDSIVNQTEGANGEIKAREDKADNKTQSMENSVESKINWERRMTRSQARKSRNKESSEESISSEEISSNYLQGVEDSELKIIEVGAKCGIYKGKGRGREQRKSIKKGKLNGNP